METFVKPGNKGMRFLALTLLAGALCTSASADLRGDFLSPPDSARPWVYYFIMDGNLSPEGVTADFEAMQEAGIGGMIVMEVAVGIPRGPVAFMSDAWCEIFAHAVHEAERLGLEIALNAGPGWTGSGGPWVKAEDSMQHLVASETQVTGPAHFDEALPVPEPRPPYFGLNGWPEALLAARDAFYADVAVLAVPETGTDARIPDIDEKALYTREPYSSKPGVKPFLPAPADYPETPPGGAIPVAAVIDLTAQLGADGRLRWDVPEGAWTILRFGRRTTGANTRPAPEPGIGFECDKFDPAALEAHFNRYIGRLLDAAGPMQAGRASGWTMLHIDSWEMGAQNWTAAFRQVFLDRRGYDPLPYLPALSGRIVENAEISARFLWDLRQTAQELVIENYARPLKRLGAQHGFRLSIEPYDMNPTSDTVLGSEADVPMCEFWSQGYGFDTVFSCIEAASVAHTLGRKVVGAESFTAGSNEAWKLYPGAMKNQGDWAFCMGINRIVFHRFAHQPWLDRRPGMTMGPYGVHWDRTQTWWPMAGAYHRYLARCQHLLRQGAPVADLCYLIPEGAPHVFRPPKSALEGDLPDRRGYNFDGCTPVALLEAKVADGRIVLPGGTAYRLLVLPDFDTMTPELTRKIAQLAADGTVVAGNPPRKSPSLENYPECDREVEDAARELWGTLEAPDVLSERTVGQGMAILGKRLYPLDRAGFPELYPEYGVTARLLAGMGVPPDFSSDGPIRYIHRRTPELDLYFVANRTGKRLETRCTFRVANRQPELWDPLTGEVRGLPEYAAADGRTILPLQFAPYQSYFVVFRDHAQDAPRAKAASFERTLSWFTLDGPWELAFDPAWGGPERIAFETLGDWRQRPEEGIRHYSGMATYRKTFDLPGPGPDTGPLWLDLGEVHCMARVQLNGKDLGVLWCAPWRVDISGAVQAAGNELRIEVANLWPNRLIGDMHLSSAHRLSWSTWNPYKRDDPLLPSGLLGPVTLQRDAREE